MQGYVNSPLCPVALPACIVHAEDLFAIDGG
jgi:hypothetical protein